MHPRRWLSVTGQSELIGATLKAAAEGAARFGLLAVLAAELTVAANVTGQFYYALFSGQIPKCTPIIPEFLQACENPGSSNFVEQLVDNLNLYKCRASGLTTTQIDPAKDPNDIVGPAGFGSDGFVTSDPPLSYQINFLNKPEAVGPAEEVVVTEQLDPNMDMDTFELGDFGFGAINVTVPAGRQFYSTRIDLRSTRGVFVDIIAQLDRATRIVTWKFDALDPETMDLPSDPSVGFLPPDKTEPEGEGHVSFSIRAKPNLPTGTRINAKATIVFDTNAPIDSNVATNTLDVGSPTSSVTALAAASPATFMVSWSGADDAGGSGIATYDIYVSDNGGAFTLFQTATTQTSATFTGQDGHTYGFYSVATDNVGHREPTPAGFQASTTVDGEPPTSTVTALPAFEPTSFVLHWSGSDTTGGSGLASYTIYVSDNGSGFTPFVANTTQTSTTFVGQAGHTYGFFSTATDNVGNVEAAHPSADTQTTTLAPIVVNSTQVNDGSAQRSMVQSLTVSFNHAVTLDTGAFSIVLHANSTINGVTGQTSGTLPVLGWTTSDGGLSYVITFSGAGVVNNSIADGLYDLDLDHTKAHDAANQLLATDAVFSFYRLYGDFNGDGTVNNADSFQFSRAFNKSAGQAGFVAFFDFNGDGTINNSDNFQFSRRFNTTFRL